MFHLRPLHWMCAFDISQSKYQGFGFSSAPFSSLWWLDGIVAMWWTRVLASYHTIGGGAFWREGSGLLRRAVFSVHSSDQASRGYTQTWTGWWFQPLWINISQLGWLFPKYGTIKAMFQTTKQWMFPTRRNEKAKWLASARTSKWDPMDRLRITRDLVAVISQQTYCWSKIKGHWISLQGGAPQL